MSYSRVSDHRAMSLDLRRNQAYLEALRKIITPDSVVLDLGAGLGVHGVLAARLGAKHVYLVEAEEVLSVAAEIADANGIASRLTCSQGRIEEIDLPEKVDVIVSVFAGNLLLIEDLLPSLFSARKRFLKPQGVLIPQGGLLKFAPISAPDEFQQNIAAWSEPHLGVTFEAVRHYAANSLFFPRDKLKVAVPLADALVALELDFSRADSTMCEAELEFSISSPGECHGIAGWFEIDLGGQWFSTAPNQPPTHWSPAFLPLDPPIAVEPGNELQLSIVRPPKGDWTWRVVINGTEQIHSTFHSHAISPRLLTQSSIAGTPVLSTRGVAARWVLSKIDGTASLGQIAEDLATEFFELFTDDSDALSFVQYLAREYA